jgi:hypothetical protein
MKSLKTSIFYTLWAIAENNMFRSMSFTVWASFTAPIRHGEPFNILPPIQIERELRKKTKL